MKVLLPIFLLMCLVSPGGAQSQVYTSNHGFQFEIGLIPQKKTIILGEPIYMDFVVSNLSNKAFSFSNGGDYRNSIGRPESFEVEVVDADGNEVPQPKLNGISMGGLVGFVTVGAQKSAKIRLYLPHWATFQRAGDYGIKVKRTLGVRDPATATEYREGLGIPVIAAAKLRVDPVDSAKLGAIVDHIGRSLLEQDETAIRLAPYLVDPRFIQYLALAIEKNAALMRSLATFSDDRALDAILSRKADPDSEVRRNVSVALSLSVHPGSKKHLITMRTDENVGIRLDVVHYLGKTKTAESTRFLREMVNDNDQKWIGSEARRYLTERGESIN